MDKTQIAGTSGPDEKAMPVSGNGGEPEPHSITNADETKERLKMLADLIDTAAGLADELAFLVYNLKNRR